MKIHQLKALVVVADTGSLRAASRLMELSPAAVTKAIRELEEEVGSVLVLRETRGVTFTDAGRALLVHARLVVGQLKRAEEDMSRLAGQSHAVLRVGIASWLAVSCLGEAVTLFQQTMPEVRLEFFEGVLTVSVPRLRDGTLDLCIGRSLPGAMSEDFEHAPLFRISSAVVARQGHPLAHCRSFAQLADAQWVLNWTPGNELQVTVDPADAFFRYLREYRPRVHVAHSQVIATSLVRGTDILTVMPWPLVEATPERAGLCTLPITEVLNEAICSIITRRGKPLSAAAQCFIDCLRSVIQRMAQSDNPADRRLFHAVDDLVP